MKHLTVDFACFVIITISYLASKLIGKIVLDLPDMHWYFTVEKNIYVVIVLLYILVSKYHTLKHHIKHRLKSYKEKRKEPRYQYNVSFTLSLLSYPLNINVTSIDKSSAGLHVIVDSSIKGLIKEGQIIKSNDKSLLQIYKIKWVRTIEGQHHIGLCVI